MIIVLNYNGVADTLECLDSISRMHNPPCETVLVDNGSSDGSVAEVRRMFPGVLVIENGANLGFAGGMNVGLRYAKERRCRFAFLLNNDTLIEPNLIGEMLEYARSHEEVGIICPRVVDYEDPNISQPPRHGDILDPVEHEEVSGPALLIRLSALERVGLLDETFFCYWEETDFCRRTLEVGIRVVYLPTRSRVFHKRAATSSKVPGFWQYYMTRNGFLFFRRHNHGWRLLRHFVTSVAMVGSPHLSFGVRLTQIRAIHDGLVLALRNPAPPGPLGADPDRGTEADWRDGESTP